MERRNGDREPVRVDVVLYRNGLPLFSGTTRNIGAGGLFLEMPRKLLKPGDRVHLDVSYGERGKVHHDRLSATVIHDRADGIGCIFHAVNEELLLRVRSTMPPSETLQLEREGQMFSQSHSPAVPWA